MAGYLVSEEVALATYDCPSAVAVGDWVYLSDTNEVDVADNGSAATCDVFGVCILKPSATRALIRSFGRSDIFSGLTPTQRYWMGSAGAMTATPPTSGVLQELGRAITATMLHVDIRPRTVL